MGYNGAKRTGFAGRQMPGMLTRTALVVAVSLTLVSCASMPRTAFTEREQNSAEIPGLPNVRFFADAPAGEIKRALGEDSIRSAAQKAGRFEMLALSGGAWDGAYGAGILNGWTKSGKRPEFTVVTGVSAGSLIAPLAFLGPDYDAELKDAYTSGAAEPIGDGTDNIIAVASGGSMRRDALLALVSRYVDQRLLRAVADAHAQGRRLLVVTTNLDAQRAVVWNMGVIASRGDVQLFREVLTASSSVPGMFNPTRITVKANGRQFEELHVDGGVTTNVFTLPDAMLANGGPHHGGTPGSMYVIMNTSLAPEFAVQDTELAALAGRSISTLIKANSKTTLLASIEFARSTGIDFNMTHINKDLPKDLKPSFSTDYMRAMYKMGYNRAIAGNFWEKTISSKKRL
jgi:hypothetical protein